MIIMILMIIIRMMYLIDLWTWNSFLVLQSALERVQKSVLLGTAKKLKKVLDMESESIISVLGSLW